MSAPTRITHLVGGAERSDEGARTAPVHDPATGRPTGVVELASAELVDEAVQVAHRAWADDWRHASLARRAAVLFAFRELLHARREEIAALVTAEHGKVHDDALGEVARGLEVADLACGIGHLLRGHASENASTGVDVQSARRPLGVVAVVSPFNFPVMVPLWFVPLAIACGNAVVLKPSEKDPTPALAVARLWQEAGLPDGVLNVVNGDAEAVDALLVHPQVRAVSFVGSTPVARHVYETAAAHGKRVQALGGAKNHLLVLPDADLDAAADAAVSAAYGSAGERCMAISVLVVVEPVGDDLVGRIRERIGRLRIGPGTQEVDLGPLISAEHRDRVAGYVAAGQREGATVVVDGRQVPAAAGDGFFLGATLLDHVDPAMSVYTDEIFGPVLCVVRVASFEEGLALVNASPYGNGAVVFTRDGAAARRFRAEAEAGMVGVNVPVPVPVAHFSFGGWKDSLFGDTHAYGDDGVRFFTRTQVVTSRWPEPGPGGVDLGFPRSV